jgi:hypothetical protein
MSPMRERVGVAVGHTLLVGGLPVHYAGNESHERTGGRGSWTQAVYLSNRLGMSPIRERVGVAVGHRRFTCPLGWE